MTSGCDVVHEPGDANPFAAVLCAGQPDLAQRAIHESDQVGQAATQYRSGAAVDRHRSSLQRVKSQERGVEEVPSFVSEEPQIVAQTPRMSYGLVDILLPMTPPKPKGARLVRGPLKFHQP